MPGPKIPSELRELVRSRANECCEYCRIPDEACFTALEIDHIIAEQHGGLTEALNRALACLPCNKRKGPNIASIDPLTGALSPLYNPRQHIWSEHFASGIDGRIDGRTKIGRATVQLLAFNDEHRMQERRLLILAGRWTPRPG